MQTLLSELTISMSEFKKNPAAALRQTDGRPLAVLNHNRVGFYVLEPQLLEAMLAQLAGTLQAGKPTEAVSLRPLIDVLLSQTKARGEVSGTMPP